MRPALIAGLIYAACLLALGIVLGGFRTLLFEPWLGPWPALLIELPVILYAAWHLTGMAMEGRELTRAGAGAMGAVAVVLLLIGEIVLALYAEPRHQLGLAAQILAGLFPLIRHWRNPPRPPAREGEVLGA